MCSLRIEGADKWTDIAAVIGGRQKQSKRFQHAQTVTDRVRAAHPHATTTDVGFPLEGIRTGYKGTHKQITFNKATSFLDALYKCRTPTQTDYRKTGDIISVLFHV
jgi:hypothetical protein